jgi:integrase
MGSHMLSDASSSLTLGELVRRFLVHADDYYRRPDRVPTGEADNLRSALTHLVDLAGNLPADDLSRHQLRALQRHLTERHRSRPYINRILSNVKRCIRWGVREDLVHAQVLIEFEAVAPLARGRSTAREPEPVEPIALSVVEQTLRLMPPMPRAVCQLLQLTGSRIGEITNLRVGDINREDPDCWWAVPRFHKGSYRGHRRSIPLDRRCQNILLPFLPLTLFAEHARDVPIFESNRRPGRSIRTTSVAYAIRRACLSAGVQHWHPHQLRHTVATLVRDRVSIDAAQALLGHAKPDTTLIYAKLDASKARRAQEAL